MSGVFVTLLCRRPKEFKLLNINTSSTSDVARGGVSERHGIPRPNTPRFEQMPYMKLLLQVIDFVPFYKIVQL